MVFIEENKRPTLPPTRVTTPALTNLLNACWDRDPALRPSFKRIAADLKQLRVKSGSNVEETESPRPKQSELFADPPRTRPSPDMRPFPLPNSPGDSGYPIVSSPGSDSTSFQPAIDFTPGKPSFLPRLKTSEGGEIRMPEPVLYTPSVNTSRASSIFDSSGGSLSSVLEEQGPAFDGYESPPPATDMIAEMRNERRYRLLLTHDFHPSRAFLYFFFALFMLTCGTVTLPLWTPTRIRLGAVGYLDKPSGEFITLFNSFDPVQSSNIDVIKDLPSLFGYGRVSRHELRQDKRNAAQRGLDALSGFLTFKSYS